jgi:HSP20 family molecular chaperone IbpA
MPLPLTASLTICGATEDFVKVVRSSTSSAQGQSSLLNRFPTPLCGRAINNRPLRRIDIHHDDKANTVTAIFDLPGMQKDDVNIDIHNNILTVSGETKATAQRDEEGYTLRERRYGKFSRSISMPQGAKVSCL